MGGVEERGRERALALGDRPAHQAVGVEQAEDAPGGSQERAPQLASNGGRSSGAKRGANGSRKHAGSAEAASRAVAGLGYLKTVGLLSLLAVSAAVFAATEEWDDEGDVYAVAPNEPLCTRAAAAGRVRACLPACLPA